MVTIQQDYEVSSEGGVRHWEIPYGRLTDILPTPSNPAEVTSLLAGTQLTGTILTIDPVTSIAIIDFTVGMVYNHHVRNVLTYTPAETTWGPINAGDLIYYDSTPALAAAGIYLSTSPAAADASANTLFGYAVPMFDADVFPKGGIVGSLQSVGVMQIGAGH